MATKSILKSIIIKDRKSCRALVNALENAMKKPSKKVSYSRAVRNADDETIINLFGEDK